MTNNKELCSEKGMDNLELKTDEANVFENRELSWLKFNERVLEEANNRLIPLCERMTFLSIFQTNLDEFFMVRVGSLKDQKLLDENVRENKTNMTPQQQIDAIIKRVKQLNIKKEAAYREIISETENNEINIVDINSLSKSEKKTISKYFKQELMPLLSVMIVGRKQPFPFLKGKEIYAIAGIGARNDKEKIGIIQCSTEVIPRLIRVETRQNAYILSEQLILYFISDAFKGYKVTEKTCIRVTRNADIDVHKVYDEDLNYRDQMAKLVKLRKKLAPVRLELSDDISDRLLNRLCDLLDIDAGYTFISSAPLDFSFLFQIEDWLRKNPDMVFKRRIPQQSADIDITKPIIPQILDHDILLSFPYESMNPFIMLLHEAAKDPMVISIRMTLYRLAKNSKIVEALAEAAENGKQVDVLVELKARFDEENNIEWSRRLEDAGCHVVYGIDELKVHSKLCLITRKEKDKIEYITQVGTGNYNENTARLYTDLSLMTASEKIGRDAVEVFHEILIGNVVESTECLLVAPKCLQKPILDMIDHEIEIAKQGGNAYIGIKINSLTDKKIIEKLVSASQAGVKIDMVVRGICCLRSQILGKTDNIHIVSIVGRYLEHSRIYIFGTPERDKIYIGSADFMTRNTLRRVEVASPIYNENIKKRIRDMFNLFLSDNVKARTQMSDGKYIICEDGGKRINAQESLYVDAYRKAGNIEQCEQ